MPDAVPDKEPVEFQQLRHRDHEVSFAYNDHAGARYIVDGAVFLSVIQLKKLVETETVQDKRFSKLELRQLFPEDQNRNESKG